MRYYFCLIGLTVILIYTFKIQQTVSLPAVADDNRTCNYEVTTNLPLSAIENSIFSLSTSYSDQQNLPSKTVRINSINRPSAEISSSEFLHDQSHPYWGKSTSLFLLFHFSQSLWNIFRC